MKRMAMVLCGLLLAFSLSGCAGGAQHEPPAASSAVLAQSSETASTSSAESSVPVPVSPAESNEPAQQESSESGEPEEASTENDASVRQIQITAADGQAVTFTLNDSAAADGLYQQLPLSVTVEDFGGSEKIFYPPEKLDTGDAPPAQGPAGTLAYYEPWGNVAMFYGECGGASGLYALGDAISGADILPELSGEIRVEAADVPSASLEALGTESTSAQQSPPVSTESPSPQKPMDEFISEEDTAMKLIVQIGNCALKATLEENAAANSFLELMKTAPVVIQMSDYSGFEKVGSLGTNLPASDSQTTTRSGDIVLYNGNQIVIFYGSNSWSYTRLGKIDDLTGWGEALGNGDVTVTFSVG